MPAFQPASPPTAAPCPDAVACLAREWIERARRGEAAAGSAEDKQLERQKHLFGTLELPGSVLQVFVQLIAHFKDHLKAEIEVGHRVAWLLGLA